MEAQIHMKHESQPIKNGILFLSNTRGEKVHRIAASCVTVSLGGENVRSVD